MNGRESKERYYPKNEERRYPIQKYNVWLENEKCVPRDEERKKKKSETKKKMEENWEQTNSK